jgi:hypothetical protein
MSAVASRIAARLPVVLRSAAARIGAGIRSAAPRIAGAARQAGSAVARAVRSPAGRIALGAAAIGGGIGLGSYLALSGLGAGQAYSQYATDQALMGEPPPGPPPLPWGQDFLVQPQPLQPLGAGPPGAIVVTGSGVDSPRAVSGRAVSEGYVNRLAAFFTSPFVLFILLLFVLAIIGIYVWKKTGK